MKSIKLFLILFIVPLILSEEDSFSINPFIKRLRDEGLLDIIISIKKIYGKDVAIIACEELNINNSGNCQRLVLDYIPDYEIITRGPLKPESIKSEIKETIKEILKKKFPFEESNLIADNIVSKITISDLFEIIKNILTKNKNKLKI